MKRPAHPTPAHRSPGRRAIRAVAVLASLAAACSVLALTPVDPLAPVGPGTRAAGAAPAPGDDPDPGTPGPHPVEELTYDLGDEAFLPEGFPGAVELRAKVYSPATLVGEAPLVVVMHGRHVVCATDDDYAMQWPCPAAIPEVPSYAGYDDLGRLLASHGVIVASIGANGINAVDGYTTDQGMNARGRLFLEHLRLWTEWNEATSGPFGDRFVGHVDTGRIGLMGHSRGGEGAVTAAVLNQRRSQPYAIRVVSALAPVDFERRVLGGVPLQVVLPYCDGDVSDLQGAGYYDDSRFATPGDLAPKQTTLLWGANHNFFNTVWTEGPGSFDDSEFYDYPGTVGEACSAGTPGRLTGPEQSAAGAAIMGGFLRRHLLDDATLQPFVTGVTVVPASMGSARYAVAHHAPDRLDIAPWADADAAGLNPLGGPLTAVSASPGTVCRAGYTYFEGYDPTPICPYDGGAIGTTTVLAVGWVEPTAVARSRFPGAGVDATSYDGIRFRIAFPADVRNDRRARQGASVRIVDATGATATVDVSDWSPAFARRPGSWVTHSVLNGVRVPLSAFEGIDLSRVRTVEVRFDRTDSGRALLSDLAFTREGTDERVGPAAGATTGEAHLDACAPTAAARWACAVAEIAWARPAYDGPELDGLVATYGSAPRRSARLSGVVGGPTAAVTAIAEAAQIIGGGMSGSSELGYYVQTARGSWEDGLARFVEDNMWLPPVADDPGRLADRLTLALLGRLPDAASRAYWANRITTTGARAATIAMLRTAERADRVISERYQQIVGWGPDPASRTYWLGRVRRPGGEKALVLALLRSDSFTHAVR